MVQKYFKLTLKIVYVFNKKGKNILVNLDLLGSGSDRKFVNFFDPILDPIQ